MLSTTQSSGPKAARGRRAASALLRRCPGHWVGRGARNAAGSALGARVDGGRRHLVVIVLEGRR
eukprot:11098278-Alexandrium_andersonii.AAC.1